jgi:hypothetical protein
MEGSVCSEQMYAPCIYPSFLWVSLWVEIFERSIQLAGGLGVGKRPTPPYQDGVYQYSVDGWPLPLMFYTAILPLILQTTLILLPSLWGMHQGLQPPSRLLQTILWVVAVVIGPSVGSLFWWPFHGSWQMRLLLLAAYWPVGYLAVTEIGRRRHHRIGSI